MATVCLMLKHHELNIAFKYETPPRLSCFIPYPCLVSHYLHFKTGSIHLNSISELILNTELNLLGFLGLSINSFIS